MPPLRVLQHCTTGANPAQTFHVFSPKFVDLAGCGVEGLSVRNQMITESLFGHSIAAQLGRSLDLVNKTLSNLRNGIAANAGA
jgi:hypothetical protein